MSALFENFLYPLIILFSVPLAAAGGFLGIFLVNRFVAPQPLDILTMLGFVILVGIVVNNAILIVHQSLNNIREHAMAPRQAITESVRSRIRPIYMSSITTVFGMLPIALASANDLNVSFMPYVIAVMLAASTTVATPIGYPTNLMVYGPGGYRFSDYLRIGGPLSVIIWILSVCTIPLVWPF